jgi:hypothetical protein
MTPTLSSRDISMSDVAPTPLRGRFLWASTAVVLVHTALAFAQADQLRLEALLQEGDLILEEAATLAPSDAQLAQEGQQLSASEKTLREEVQSLNQNITQFNAATAEQNKAVQTFHAQCPAHIKDQALAEACDKRIAELREQANLLEDDRLQLRARQEELNARVNKQDAWLRDYVKRKGAQDAQGRLNQRDSDEWLGRAKQFLVSEDFAALLAHASSPQACGADQMGELATPGGRVSLERIQVCLKALKAGNQ